MAIKNYDINNQTEAITYFITQMDLEMIDAFLDAKKTYQDMEMVVFISKLKKVFQLFKESGDSTLIPFPGQCNSCCKDKRGFTFVGNYSLNYISIIVDTENGFINDMFECSDFINNDKSLILNTKFYIDDILFEL